MMSLPSYQGTVQNVYEIFPVAADIPVSPEQRAPPLNTNATNPRLQPAGSTPADANRTDPIKDHESFLKWKPKAFGIVVIVASIIQIGIAIVLCFYDFYDSSILFDSGIILWGALFGIISGSLSIAAQLEPNSSLIKCSLSMTVITLLPNGLAAIMAILDIFSVHTSSTNYPLNRIPNGLAIAVLALNGLLFIVTLVFSVMECRSLEERMAPFESSLMDDDGMGG